jgi:uncharacterized protein YjiS (DUF1127 family)
MTPHHITRSQLPLSGAFRRMMEARRRRKNLHALLAMDDSTLRDIGLTRGHIIEAYGNRRSF